MTRTNTQTKANTNARPNLAQRFFLFVLAVTLAWLPLHGQAACGAFTAVGDHCERYVTFPWYAAGANWTSQIPVLVPIGSTGPVTVRFGIGAGMNTGLLPGQPVQSMFGGIAGNYNYFSTTSATIPVGGSARLDLVSGAICAGTACALSSPLAVGALSVLEW